MSEPDAEQRGVWIITWKRAVFFGPFDTPAHWFWPSAWGEISSGGARYIHDFESFNVAAMIVEAAVVRHMIIRDERVEAVKAYALAHMN